MEEILDIDTAIYGQLTTRISTPKLNKAFEEFTRRLSPPMAEGKQVKIFYVSQLKSVPPTFILFLNYPGPYSGALQEIPRERAEGKIRLQGHPDKTPFQEEVKGMAFRFLCYYKPAAKKEKKYRLKRRWS